MIQLLILIINLALKQKGSILIKKMFFNPCKCQCEKEIIRNELVVIVKRFSPTKRKSMPVIGGINKLATVAMEPKHMQVKKHNIFKEKSGQSFERYLQFCFQQSQNPIIALNMKPRKSVNQMIKVEQTSKILSIKNSQQIMFNKEQNKNKVLKQKIILNSSEDQTQRKTFKKYNNATKPKKQQNSDMVQTTKRCKKKQSINLLQSPTLSKNSLPQIDQIFTKNLADQSNKENRPNSILQNSNTDKKCLNQNKQTQNMIKLMNDQISILKNQLKRLEDDEKSLLIQKDQNEKFFQQDYVISQKKKQNLKKNCHQRSQELKELKQLLRECRNRNV